MLISYNCFFTTNLNHILDSKSESEKPYLTQPDFQLKIGMCEHTYSTPGCLCNVKFALDTKFKLPLLEHDDLLIVNSCNGLLCFSLGAHVIICNPVLGEFISLPMDKKADDFCGGFSNYGFGFSHVGNKYKVLKMISNIGRNRAIARVHIVGTNTWRDFSIEFWYFRHRRPIYLRGFLYWFVSTSSLPFFDVENECFGTAQGPKLKNLPTHQWTTLGVLAGELCVSFSTFFGTFHVWARKGNGVEKRWSQVLSIDWVHGKHIDYPQPIKHFSGGSLLMFNGAGMPLVPVDPIKRKFRYLNIGGTKSKVEALFAHVPSLISLRHSLSGDNTKGLDVQSRCEELKLRKQMKDVRLYIIEA